MLLNFPLEQKCNQNEQTRTKQPATNLHSLLRIRSLNEHKALRKLRVAVTRSAVTSAVARAVVRAVDERVRRRSLHARARARAVRYCGGGSAGLRNISNSRPSRTQRLRRGQLTLLLLPAIEPHTRNIEVSILKGLGVVGDIIITSLHTRPLGGAVNGPGFAGPVTYYSIKSLAICSLFRRG